MKKIFAAFCALVLMPSFSAQAWIGGPFSKNTYFEENGDDGVYEAVASTINGIGLYRFAVGNEFDGVNPQGVNASVPAQDTAGPDEEVISNPSIASGNFVIGALANQYTCVWYYEGVQYFGFTLGTVNSSLGQVVGLSDCRDNRGQGVNSLSTSFRARLSSSSEFIPSSAFQGVGKAVTSQGTRFRFTVLGSRISNRITYGL